MLLVKIYREKSLLWTVVDDLSKQAARTRQSVNEDVHGSKD